MKRKWLALLLCCALVLTFAAACGRNKDDAVKPDDSTNNMTNNGNAANNQTVPNNNGSNNTNTPGNMVPGNDSNKDDTATNGEDGNYPTFPNSLSTTDTDVAVRDLFDTLGLTETDLDNAMRDIATVGDGVDGARTYRHKMLGDDVDISYGFDDHRNINKVTVSAKPATFEQWRTELRDTLGAEAVEGQPDSWTYDDNMIKIEDQGTHVLITIEKKA